MQVNHIDFLKQFCFFRQVLNKEELSESFISISVRNSNWWRSCIDIGSFFRRNIERIEWEKLWNLKLNLKNELKKKCQKKTKKLIELIGIQAKSINN